jgi:L-threonylcarbamoyladenylate synthase
MPSSVIARRFIKECNVPVAAPSANLSGSPSPTSFIHVLKDFRNKIPCILIGPDAKHGIESTVVDCTVEQPIILRPGVITYEMLRKIIPGIKKYNRSAVVKSPGQKYRHYAPKAKVITVKHFNRIKIKSINSAFIGFKNAETKKGKVKFAVLCKNETGYARKLFSFFRQCDEKGIKFIYCQEVKEKGIGLAIMNRLKKASSIIY